MDLALTTRQQQPRRCRQFQSPCLYLRTVTGCKCHCLLPQILLLLLLSLHTMLLPLEKPLTQDQESQLQPLNQTVMTHPLLTAATLEVQMEANQVLPAFSLIHNLHVWSSACHF